MAELPLYSALGCAVTLNVGDRPAGDIGVIERAWRSAVVRDDDPLPARHVTVTVPSGPVDRSVAALSQAVTLAAIDARRGDLWMLHAGAVADPEGRVVAVVGPSGRGKTTATRELGRHYGYVTDETLGVAADGTVLPYRKPLSIIEQPMADKRQRSPQELGLGELPAAPLRLAAVVMLDRDPGMGERAELSRCELGDVLPELVEQTSYLGELPAPLRTIAAHVAAVGGVHRVAYGEASALPDALAPLFADPSAPVLPDPVETAPIATGVTGERWYRASFVDAVSLDEDGERLAVFNPDTAGGTTMRLLDGIGPVLWSSASGAPLEAIVDATVAVYGEPEGVSAHDTVRSAVAALREGGVLATEPAWRVRDDVAWTGEAGAYIALALSTPGSPEPVSLDGTAGLIWQTVARSRGATSSALTRAIADAGELDEDAIAADVDAFLESLADRALVERYTP